jgi:cysteine desulfurase
MEPYLREEFGNASSATHVYGWRAEAAVEQAREEIAAAIGAADPREIVFTSGTTESDNLALAGIARARSAAAATTWSRARSSIPRCSTRRARWPEHDGCTVTELSVGEGGLVDPESVRAAIGARTRAGVDRRGPTARSVRSSRSPRSPRCVARRGCRSTAMRRRRSARCRSTCDATASTLLSFCAHKLYGPKGIGALYVRRGGRPPLALAPLLHGGGPRARPALGHHAGPLVVGFARAVSLCLADREAEAARLARLRDRLLAGLHAALPGQVRCNGDPVRRLPGNLNVSFAGVRSRRAAHALHDVALSSRIGLRLGARRAEPRAARARPAARADPRRAALRSRPWHDRGGDRHGDRARGRRGAEGRGGRRPARVRST